MITLKIAAAEFFPSLAPTQVRFYGKPGAHSENELVWQFEDGVPHLCTGSARSVGRW